MAPTPSPKMARVQRLLDQRNLPGLVVLLRQPADSELRAQAAWALGELHQMEAAESLSRSVLEDPDPAVQAAARQALRVLVGADTELVLASYRQDRPTGDWLSTSPGDDSFETEDPQSGESDLTGLAQIAWHEPNLDLRLRAVRRMARSTEFRVTDILAELARWGDPQSIRDAAREAIESIHGDRAETILSSYQNSTPPDEDDEFAEDEETTHGPLDPELAEDGPEDLTEDLDEDEWDDDVEDENGEEDELADIFPKGQQTPPPSPYASSIEKEPTRPVVEEMGIPWGSVAWILLILIVLFVIFTVLRP